MIEDEDGSRPDRDGDGYLYDFFKYMTSISLLSLGALFTFLGMETAEGVPDVAILVEERSRTTRENIENSVPLLRAHNLDRVLIVSDPLHMRRAMAIARSLGLNAHPSPTRTTRYTGWGSWAGFLVSEAYHLNRCRIVRTC